MDGLDHATRLVDYGAPNHSVQHRLDRVTEGSRLLFPVSVRGGKIWRQKVFPSFRKTLPRSEQSEIRSRAGCSVKIGVECSLFANCT